VVRQVLERRLARDGRLAHEAQEGQHGEAAVADLALAPVVVAQAQRVERRHVQQPGLAVLLEVGDALALRAGPGR